MTYELPTLPLTDSEKIWLKEIIDAYFDEKKIDERKLRIELDDKLDKEFGSISPYNSPLLQDNSNNGYIIPSLWGIWHIYPDHQVFGQIDKIIVSVKQSIKNNVDKIEIAAEELSKQLDIPVRRIELILQLLYRFGRFIGGYRNSSEDKPGITLFYINSIDITLAYLHYNNLNEEMNKRYKIENKEQSISAVPYIPSPRIGSPLGYGNFASIQETATKAIPNTAFIIMQINPDIPELVDVSNTIKAVCKNFGIDAKRVNDIEHQDKITDVILEKISSSEFIIADLSGERPNVYYEIGYAHAINKRPILFKDKKTKLHFDLAGHNVPEYKNNTELRELLIKRLEAITGKTLEQAENP